MPRSIRIEYEGAFYHVMARGNRQEVIFVDDEDRWIFRFSCERSEKSAAWRDGACLCGRVFRTQPFQGETPFFGYPGLRQPWAQRHNPVGIREPWNERGSAQNPLILAAFNADPTLTAIPAVTSATKPGSGLRRSLSSSRSTFSSWVASIPCSVRNRREPAGKTHIRVCRTLCCAMAGGCDLMKQMCNFANIEHDEHGRHGSPNSVSPDDFYGAVTETKTKELVAKYSTAEVAH